MRRGDFNKAEPYRHHARLWLPGDELLGGRAAGERLGIDKVREIRQQLAAIYTTAETRDDVEDRELAELHPDLHNVHAGTGMQVHVPYTVYAHFILMRELMLGSGVREVQYSMDCEFLLRAAFYPPVSRKSVPAQHTGSMSVITSTRLCPSGKLPNWPQRRSWTFSCRNQG